MVWGIGDGLGDGLSEVAVYEAVSTGDAAGWTAYEGIDG